MLTRLVIRNFKRFQDADIELGNPVVLIGPNNSGKTTALQALSLWNIGVRRWQEKRPRGTINRRDLLAVPVPDAKLLWRDLHVRDMRRVDGKPVTKNVTVEILVEGVTAGRQWQCGLEFDYANAESLYCRPVRLAHGDPGVRMPVPPEAALIKVAFLPPMSGLAAQEVRLDSGAINVRVGEGRTAEVLRNLCYQIVSGPEESRDQRWSTLAGHIERLFGVSLRPPEYIAERGEITMSYGELGKEIVLDLSAAGRGLHQTLLVLAYLYANPGSVLLLDEPDAHLEILRQRETYQLLVEVAQELGSQIIAASHSEVVLSEAVDQHVVVAFVGPPHRIDNRGSQVQKALRSIGFDQYYLAETRGWVLYVEGSSDLAILKSFARSLGHPAADHLERPFVHYVENQPQRTRDHFFGLKEAKKDLAGVALFDRLDALPESGAGLQMLMWERRELENYLCFPEALLAYARGGGGPGGLFEEEQEKAMRQCVEDLAPPVALRDRNDPWWSNVKASDDFLDRLFETYFKRLGLPNLMRKSNYHELAPLVPREMIPPELVRKLDAIVAVAESAKPLTESQ